MTKRKPNNTQIDNTSYYALPSGRQLEDFIADRNLSFAMGSAVKYLYRAGKKDGEDKAKDLAKADHFVRFIAKRVNRSNVEVYNRAIDHTHSAQNEIEPPAPLVDDLEEETEE